MKPKRLLWQLYPSYLLITLISLAAIGWYASSSMQQFYYTQVAEDLKASARVIEEQVLASYETGDSVSLDELCKMLGTAGKRRITVIETSGKVLADSQENPKQMDNHSDRPEIIEAMKNLTSSKIRFSRTLGLDMMYVAIPLKTQDRVIAILRIAKPVSAINEQLKSIYYKILIGASFVAVFAALLSLVVSRRISKPLEELRKGAELFADGDLSHKLSAGNCQEIDAVAKAMNQMAEEIDGRISIISRQRNEHKAVLSSMVEAVLAVDSQQRLITLNSSAAEMFGVKIFDAKGRTLQEIIRNPALQHFVTNSLAGSEPIEDNITLLKDNSEHFLQAKSSVLQDEQGQKIGILVVLNDITKLKQLEQVRRDFVANVSHELKTPITSVKGFVETLLEGAMKKPAEAKRFLDIIAKQTNRMDAIIDDLLALSRIEQQAEKAEIERENGCIKDVLESAIELCRNKAQTKQIEIELRCADALATNINMPLLEQAVVNLLDNAIKYSPAGSKVGVVAAQADEQISITVTDFGCGIDKELLARIFERFYVVDKARSRKLGGTGLGLAIVKHIAGAHNGSVTVESKPGSGSIFTIKLPA
ncbi:MAG: cell wall metabolism sensor histidine kinase WalK [Anaerohalosphaeraceae bacterium]|nr:cell wall metabolism sensor histidine kinase WalK [Anaerohalosphaeraceae bacterium]